MDAHEAGGLWLLREMWNFPQGVPEEERLDYLKTIMVCAWGAGDLVQAEREWVIGYGAACGATQATVDALESYEANEDALVILERNMPVAETWARVAIFDAIRASSADHEYDEGERAAVQQVADRLGVTAEALAAIESLHQEEQALKDKRIGIVFGNQIPYQERA